MDKNRCSTLIRRRKTRDSNNRNRNEHCSHSSANHNRNAQQSQRYVRRRQPSINTRMNQTQQRVNFRAEGRNERQGTKRALVRNRNLGLSSRARNKNKNKSKSNVRAVTKAKQRSNARSRANNLNRRVLTGRAQPKIKTSSSQAMEKTRLPKRSRAANKSLPETVDVELSMSTPPNKKRRLSSNLGGISICRYPLSDNNACTSTGDAPRDGGTGISKNEVCRKYMHPENKLPCWVAEADLKKEKGAFSTNDSVHGRTLRGAVIPLSIRTQHRSCQSRSNGTMTPFEPRIANLILHPDNQDCILRESDKAHMNFVFDGSMTKGVNTPYNVKLPTDMKTILPMGRTGFFNENHLKYYLKEALGSPLAKEASDKLNDPNLFLQQVTYVHDIPVEKRSHWVGRWMGSDLVEVFKPGSIVVTFEYNKGNGRAIPVKLKAIFPRRADNEDYWALRGIGAKYATYNINYLG